MLNRTLPLMFTAALLLPAPASAQMTGDLLLNLGGSASFVTDTEGEDINPRLGFTIGAELELGFAKYAGARVGAAYVQRGITFSEHDPGAATATISGEFDYLAASALLEVGGQFPFQALAGMSAGLNLRCNIVAEIQAEGARFSQSESCEDLDYEAGVDLSAVAGLGTRFGSFGATLLYTEGLTNTLREEEGRNRSVSLIASYRVPLFGAG